MPTDARGPVKSLPIQSFAGWDTVYDILSILQELEMGQFRSAAILADAMGRDDRIEAVTETRVDALLGSPIDVLPVDDKYKSKKYATMLGGTEDGPGEWDRMFPSGTVGEVMRSGLELNFGLAEILWSVEADGLWWPRLRFWHSQFVRWDVATGTYILRTADGQVTLPKLDEDPRGDGKWLIYCPFGYQYAWRRGLIRSLAPMYMRRMYINRDWPRFNEVHGNPIRKAIVPLGAGNTTEHDNFFADVANFHGEATVKVPQGPEGQRYDIALVEATSGTWQTFMQSKSDINTDIAVLILGQNLTTEAQGGGLGGGQVQAHNLVRIDKAKKDSNFATVLRDQVLTHWAKLNFGDPDLAPRPMYRVEPPESENDKAIALKAWGDALQSMHLADAPIDDREILEEAGVPMLTEEEVAAKKAAAVQDAQAAIGGTTPDVKGPGDSGPPKPVPGGEVPQGAPVKKGLSANAAQFERVVASIVNLVERESGIAALRAQGSAVSYPDKLTKTAAELGAKVLAPDLAGLKDEIDRATSFEELEKKIVELYRDMDPAELARIVHRARLMGNLAGKLTVQKGK